MNRIAPEDDTALRRLLQRADPLHDSPPLRLTVTAAQLRERAALRRPPWGLAVAAAACTAAVAVGVAWAVRPSTADPMPPSQDPAVPVTVSATGGAAPALETLRGLAARARTLPDAAGGRGEVTHVTYRIRAGGGPEQEVRVWWAADRSAHERRTPAAAGSPSIRDHAPGGYPVAVDSPAAQPEILAGQLHHHQERTGAPNMVHAVADMFRDHCLTPAQRAAALEVLADTEGLVLRGEAVDQAGRTGIAVSLDGGPDGVRHVLVIDPGTGTLLSYEQVMRLGAATSPVRIPAQLSYVLYIDCGTTGELP